jgi:hypothetical protein
MDCRFDGFLASNTIVAVEKARCNVVDRRLGTRISVFGAAITDRNAFYLLTPNLGQAKGKRSDLSSKFHRI